MTEAYPDIVEEFQKSLKELNITNFIIDSEIVAINPVTKQILPFQVLATRSRKAAKVAEIEVAISVYAFDILYLNGPLTHLPLG
jgi:DNA ligase-1